MYVNFVGCYLWSCVGGGWWGCYFFGCGDFDYLYCVVDGGWVFDVGLCVAVVLVRLFYFFFLLFDIWMIMWVLIFIFRKSCVL